MAEIPRFKRRFTDPHVIVGVEYARQVVSGEIPACKFTILACRRQLEDLARAETDPDWPFAFEEDKAGRVCRFIELLPHVKGEWARRGELIELQPWQVFGLTTVFGWLRKSDGFRRFQTVYWEVPRKNAKSTKTSGVGLYMLTADGEAGADCFSAATKKDQAKIVFGDAKKMAERSPDLRSHFGLRVMAHRLQTQDGSKFEALDAKGSTQDGLNIHLSIHDELHAWKGRSLYDVLETAVGSRAQPLIWNITTAGDDESGICYELRSYLVKVLQRVFVDETFWGVIYTVDPGDDWKDEATWRKANPNYGISVRPEKLKAAADKAVKSSATRNNFRRKLLNVWVNAATAYFEMDDWHACAEPGLRLEDFEGEDCRLGLDLASKVDLAVTLKIFERGPLWYLFPRFWLPEVTVQESDNASYAGWVEDGWITATPGNVTDYDAIEADILGDSDEGIRGDVQRFNLLEVDYDPHQATMLVNHLTKAGVTCVELRPTVLNFSEPLKELQARAKAGTLRHDGNPVMAWNVSNVVAVEDRKDNVYPRKERPEKKIDGVVAACMAGNRVLAAKREGPQEVTYKRGEMFA